MKRAKMFDLNRVLLQPMYSILLNSKIVASNVQLDIRDKTYKNAQFEQWQNDIFSIRNGIIEICRMR